MTFDNMIWFDPCILRWLLVSFMLNGFVSYLWHKKIYLKWGLKNYRAMQRIHLNETPRLGGLIFILSLIGFMTQCHLGEGANILSLIVMSLIPCIVVALKEDLFHNVEPAIRLISLLFAGWLFRMNYSGPMPNLSEVPWIESLVTLQGGISFFYILCILTLANGMNLIDGVNGLCGVVNLIILGALLFLSFKVGDTVILSLIFSLVLLCIPFMVFNFPYGRIFLGDLGAYNFGLISGMLTIIFFGRHPK